MPLIVSNNYRIVSFVYSIILIISNQVKSLKFFEEKSCGSLYSEENSAGDIFPLNDFDQSMNLRRDYRTSIYGWQNTNSVRVEDNCTLKICNGTNLQGSCLSYQSGSYQGTHFLQSIQSVECKCKKECKCQDTAKPMTTKLCGKAYLGEGCNTCDSEYISLENQHDYHIFPFTHADSVTSITIRDACNLTLYSGWKKSGQTKTIRNIVEKFNGTIGTYKCECSDDMDTSLKPIIIESYPTTTNVPIGQEPTSSEILYNEINHSSEQRESENRRGSQNVYILLIGAPNPNRIGLHGCNDVAGKIGECHISVSLKELGLTNAQIRIIYAPIRAAGLRWAATLDEYFDNHTDLHDAIPNAVAFYHYDISDKTIDLDKTRSEFQRKLGALSLLRGRVLDEENSNLVFLLNRLEELPPSEQQNPESRIAEFEKVIENRTFPRPTVILTKFGHVDSLPKSNGYWKMPNNEYWPKNLQEALMRISKKQNDTLGHTVFKAAFSEETDLKMIYETEEELLPRNSRKVMFYKDLAFDPNMTRNFSSLRKPGQKLNVSQKMLPSNKTNNESHSKALEEVEKLRGFFLAEKVNQLKRENELKDEIKSLKLQINEGQNQIRNETMNNIRTVEFNLTQNFKILKTQLSEQIQDIYDKLVSEQRLRKEEERDRGSIRRIWQRIQMCFSRFIYQNYRNG